MTDPVRYELADGLATITMDDGKVNAMSASLLRHLHEAFDRAEADSALVLLTGRPGLFSAGFDMATFAAGREATLEMLREGAELAYRVLGFPKPVVTACNGHAYPMGAFLMLAADLRLGAAGPYRIGLNEVAIGLTLPWFAVEIARQRLAPAYFQRSTTAAMYDPEEARVAGFLDHVVPEGELLAKSREAALGLAALDMNAHAGTKQRVRGQALAALREAIDSELGANAAA